MERELNKYWVTIEATSKGGNKHEMLARTFRFPSFKLTMKFVNQVGEIAERLNHHPEMTVRWGEVVVYTWTHTEQAITDKDYELAQEIDKL